MGFSPLSSAMRVCGRLDVRRFREAFNFIPTDAALKLSLFYNYTHGAILSTASLMTVLSALEHTCG
jgi:hypothetical protein